MLSLFVIVAHVFNILNEILAADVKHSEITSENTNILGMAKQNSKC